MDQASELSALRTEMGRLAATHARTKRQIKLYESLFHRFSEPENLEENLSVVMDGLIEIFATEAGSIALLDPQQNDLYFAIARGPVADKVLNLRIQAGQGIIGACMTEKKTLAISDVKSDLRFAAQIAQQLGFDTRSILASPIIFRGQILGAVELINRHGGDDWLSHEIELITVACRAAGTFIFLAHKMEKA